MVVLYVASNRQTGTLNEPRLDATSDRHRMALPPPPLSDSDPLAALAGDPGPGVVLEMATGCPDSKQVELLRRALDLSRRAWLYWPEEGAVECVTPERLESYGRLSKVVTAYRYVGEPIVRAVSVPRRIRYVLRDIPPRELPRWAVRRLDRTRLFSGRLRLTYFKWRETPTRELPRRAVRRVARLLGWPGISPGQERPAVVEAASPGPSPLVRHARRLGALREARHAARAVPFPPFAHLPDQFHRIGGCGVYLRTDFWSPIESGGSYGHTCYVAKELAAVTESFTCFMANRFPLLDEYGIRQVVMPPPSATRNEDDIATATPHYVDLLRAELQALRPAFIYERLCLGNYAAALLSAEFGIPYIVEYNGSEISMRRSFEGTGYVYEAEYLEAEALAFEQATLITVVSAEIRKGLMARGVDAARIIVNPNGVDLDAYAPASPGERDALRKSSGFDPSDRVIGFTGTFGGWHGIDVLSDAIPRICQSAPRAKFLLIGDGNFKQLIDHAVASYGLERRVVSTGRVPQTEGARLLKACDIYVSPHSTHMVDSKFFGSPTKIFEYMALGGGIVASDLEQIGQVLSPALTPDEAAGGPSIADERSVLCAPGDVGQFVQGVLALVEQPDLARALGRNARLAAAAHYSWARHVANLWRFLSGDAAPADISPDLRRKPKQRVAYAAAMATTTGSDTFVSGQSSLAFTGALVATGDACKDEVQRHPKEYFLEAERYRYGTYAPWMPETMEFDRHGGKELLEIGGGMGTDLAQFAAHGARVTDVDLSSGHLKLAKENFAARGLQGRFILQDAESLVFEDNRFDVVYSNGVLPHTPNTRQVVREIFRVLKPGGRVIVMVYAENSLHYWRNQVWNIGLREGLLRKYSMGEIMSRSMERSDDAAAHPLVKVYTKERLRQLFDGFVDIEIVQRGKIMGWNLILKARKPTQGVSRGGPPPVEWTSWSRRRRESGCLYSTISARSLTMLREAYSDRARATIGAAERILAHEFDLLGSGPFIPADPDRQAREGYTPIDWYLDPVRRLRFPRGVPYKEWNLYGMRPANADIKYPWELARCQHWAALGQAFQLTGDDRFAREIALELDDFVEANPVGLGVNWTCTMDVALRAVSWAIGLELTRTSSASSEAFRARAYAALYDHGVFIRNNLENTYEVTSNHFLSNIVGLLFLGAVFADLPDGAEWTAFARSALEHEMDVQVLPDGADYESSIPYHRLVTELFLGSARLADHRGEPMSPRYRERLREMVAYLAAVTRPDGLMPQVGDADDGRLHVLDGYGHVSPQDGRHLFGPAGMMLEEPAWLALAGDAGVWEAAWWGFEADALPPAPDERPIGHLFPNAGTAVMRSAAGHFVVVTNGIVGTNGFGNHKHNDQLSFEYHHGRIPVVVDPGSYVYTSDPAARNQFRGTASHNTLCVDGVEQNELRPDWLFRLFETSKAEHESFEDRPDAAEYVGRHHGYERLPEPVSHQRAVRLLKPSGTLVIVDRLSGRGDHDLRWHFHLAPGISADRLDETTVALTAPAGRWRLAIPAGLQVSIGPAAYSPSYGVKTACVAIDLSARVRLDGDRKYEFTITA
jgi:glycosyltransferase involved in cell wall biosynthesis/ubiquinone/menaquinone biosynthesis C-methylase UbiE